MELWIESDSDIDDDVSMEHSNIAPQDLRDDEPEKQELHVIVKWVVLMLAIFQTRFFLTNRALNWLLKFLGTLLTFLGKYSLKIAEIAKMLPQSVYQHSISLTDGIQDICSKCDAVFKFDDCIHKVGSRIISVNHCPHKPFKRKCNEILMKEVMDTRDIIHIKYTVTKVLFLAYKL